MFIHHRFTDSTDYCDGITITIPQIGALHYLWNRAYAAGAKLLRFPKIPAYRKRSIDFTV
jgi:hypothetical protein